jgi:hypothetical protein
MFLNRKLTKSSMLSYFTVKNSGSLTQKANYVKEHMVLNDKNIHVLFISSKVPCNYVILFFTIRTLRKFFLFFHKFKLLLECLNQSVLVITYDFEYTNLNTLIKRLENELVGRKAM